jgi:hypothetical protein
LDDSVNKLWGKEKFGRKNDCYKRGERILGPVALRIKRAITGIDFYEILIDFNAAGWIQWIIAMI